MLHGTASNKRLQSVVAAKESNSVVATTHPFALSAQGRLQSGAPRCVISLDW